jgi:hypothetical protein
VLQLLCEHGNAEIAGVYSQHAYQLQQLQYFLASGAEFERVADMAAQARRVKMRGRGVDCTLVLDCKDGDGIERRFKAVQRKVILPVLVR